MGVKVAKFGGSSLASTAQIIKALDIVRSDPERRYIVASAPGKRTPDDIKVTDLLYQVYEHRDGGYEPFLDQIRQRYAEIADGLGVEVDLGGEFDRIERALGSCLRHDDRGNRQDDKGGRTDGDAGGTDDGGSRTGGETAEYFASRGEYLNSLVLAAALGWEFVDAAEVVRFSDSGEFLPHETDILLAERLDDIERAVIPGFYGATEHGQIRTFPRGGSDVTGALVARAVDADVYENWTDVSGIYAADPRIVDSPRSIEWISYAALRELTYLGASVLHENAIAPVRDKQIPINIRNTNRPGDHGTWIGSGPFSEPQPDESYPVSTLVGLAGKTGYSSITARKTQWSGSLGIGAQLLSLFDDAHILVDMLVASIDTWTFVVRASPDQTEALAQTIIREMAADSAEVRPGLALLGVVGTSTPDPELQATRGRFPTVDLGLQAAETLAKEGIWVFAMSSPGGFNTVDAHLLLIDAGNYENAVRCLYAALA